MYSEFATIEAAVSFALRPRLMVNIFSLRFIEATLLTTLLLFVIADAAGTFGLTYGPAWCLFSVYAIHSRVARSLTISIVVGTLTIITDIAYFAATGGKFSSAGAITFAVCVSPAARSCSKIFALYLLYYFLRNDIGASLSLADEAAGAPAAGGEQVYAASSGVDEAALTQAAYDSPSKGVYAAGGYQSTL
jgi:hypothetical protein